MGIAIERYKKLFDVSIDETDVERVTDRVHCTCNVCGNKWQPKLYYLQREECGCVSCKKEERLKTFQERRKKRIWEKCNEIAKERNLEIRDVVFEKDKNNPIVVFYDRNKDKAGVEFGEYRQLYYSFTKNFKSKRAVGDELRYSTEEWIERARSVHPNYDYSKVKYENNRKNVTIICPIHGEFSILPKVFMHEEYECAKCKIEMRIIKEGERVINELKERYPLLDFSESVYKGKGEKILVGYPEGKRWVICRYLYDADRPKSVNADSWVNPRKFTFQDFIERDKKVHKDGGFIINEEDFKSISEPMKMKCIKCGYEFYRTPKDHLTGHGCQRCRGRYDYSTEELIRDFQKVHGDKYDYSKVEYTKMTDKVCIICHEKDEFGREHGEFWQTPKNHIKGWGCKKCSNSYMDGETFALKANKIHGNKYDYSKVVYEKNKTKVCIICPEHGEFWQTPNCHLNGQGCPFCKTSHIERSLKKILDEAGVDYIYQYHDKDMFDRQSLDFYHPDKKLAIECQSEIHYISNFFKSKGKEFADEHLEYRQGLDERKRQVCKENGINLIYFMEERFLPMEKSDVLKFSDGKALLEYLKSL